MLQLNPVRLAFSQRRGIGMNASCETNWREKGRGYWCLPINWTERRVVWLVSFQDQSTLLLKIETPNLTVNVAEQNPSSHAYRHTTSRWLLGKSAGFD